MGVIARHGSGQKFAATSVAAVIRLSQRLPINAFVGNMEFYKYGFSPVVTCYVHVGILRGKCMYVSQRPFGNRPNGGC